MPAEPLFISQLFIIWSSIINSHNFLKFIWTINFFIFIFIYILVFKGIEMYINITDLIIIIVLIFNGLQIIPN